MAFRLSMDILMVLSRVSIHCLKSTPLAKLARCRKPGVLRDEMSDEPKS